MDIGFCYGIWQRSACKVLAKSKGAGGRCVVEQIEGRTGRAGLSACL